jgi:large subunit ribosomal protein L23
MENFNQNFGDLLNKIKYPIITEKLDSLNKKYNQYGFIVNKVLKKDQIKLVLERMFNIHIISVKTMNLPIKTKRVGKFIGRKSLYKKVYVKVKAGDIINAF